MYLTLLYDPSFTQQPFPATACVYLYAIEAALRAEDMEPAQK
ncbi:hypothetical protein [Vibrio parahaemolyticus]|nr:hypothetical protein [Vibrio parahaemolyticus]